MARKVETVAVPEQAPVSRSQQVEDGDEEEQSLLLVELQRENAQRTRPTKRACRFHLLFRVHGVHVSVSPTVPSLSQHVARTLKNQDGMMSVS